MQKNEDNAVEHPEEKKKGFDLFKILKQTADGIGSFANSAVQETSKLSGSVFDEVGKAASSVADNIGKSVNAVAKGTQDLTAQATQSIVETIDQNGDGKVDLEDVIILGMKTPGVRIDRKAFLQSELSKKLPQNVIDRAIESNPMKAGIHGEQIDKIADDVINYERNCVSGISAALGVPGGVAMAATIPADIIQYYGYMLRAAQKLMYLYGFPEIDVDENGQIFDSATMNVLIICFGAMFGLANANQMLKSVATMLGSGVEKQLMKKALTKGTIYPIVKSISKWFNVKMTKEVFAGFFKKSIPLLGGLVGGGITYVSFKPCCDKLKNTLKDTILSNPNYQPAADEVIEINDENDDIIVIPAES